MGIKKKFAKKSSSDLSMQGEIFLGHLTSGYSVVPGFVPGTNQPSISGQIILDSMKCVVVFYIVASIVAKGHVKYISTVGLFIYLK